MNMLKVFWFFFLLRVVCWPLLCVRRKIQPLLQCIHWTCFSVGSECQFSISQTQLLFPIPNSASLVFAFVFSLNLTVTRRIFGFSISSAEMVFGNTLPWCCTVKESSSFQRIWNKQPFRGTKLSLSITINVACYQVSVFPSMHWVMSLLAFEVCCHHCSLDAKHSFFYILVEGNQTYLRFSVSIWWGNCQDLSLSGYTGYSLCKMWTAVN